MRVHLVSSKRLRYAPVIIGGLILTLLGAFQMMKNQPDTHALSASDFVAGRIIDDSVFYNKDAMSVGQIQDFLNKLIPNCDTQGSGQSEYGGGTRAQYAASVGWPSPPYVCINKYYENPQTGETSFEKGGGAFDGGISAAQIIYDAGQQYGINPQVLLVTLKKESEGPLTSDSWPLKSQYTYAMGYGCPDTGANNSANCNAAQAGFYKQVTTAAWQLAYYKTHQNDYRYKLGNNQIQYSTDTTCGTKTVNIENIATLSLYIYTPYTPNTASLANYPSEAACGSYGNRNFFMYFKEWFGSPNYRAPTCDSRVSGVACVWLLYDPTNRYEFLTTNNQERDTAVLSSKYSYDSVAFYAYTTQQPGTIPIYRISLPDRHVYTPSQSEMQTLTQNSLNAYEGIAFYALPPSTSASMSYPVYRVYGDRGNILTASPSNRDTLVSQGYTDEGTSFNTPSAFVTAPVPSQGRVNVYRLFNGSNHFYTASLSEVDSLVKSGWNYEGILLEAPAQATSTPVYRLFYNKDHLFTTSKSEHDSLVQNGWSDEGVGWYVDNTTPTTYRLYVNGEHFYTTALNEAAQLSARGAKYEGVALGYTQTPTTPVYRLYRGTDHFFTISIDEVLSVVKNGWIYEGAAWQSSVGGNPVYRLSAGSLHFYTANTAERDSLTQNGWKYEGIAWQTTGDNPIYRLSAGSLHFYTSGASERDGLVGSGWKYEGSAW